ncbi:quinon protein alcohol dehydrogenase-like superfamily [Paraphysoderma sedebokerense]|nr:quinon protein alcohol dehydrogenase-like superfamily [Paraphysoderma sedebokerense]
MNEPLCTFVNCMNATMSNLNPASVKKRKLVSSATSIKSSFDFNEVLRRAETVVNSFNLQSTCLSHHWKYNMEKCIDASPLIIGFHDDDALAYIGSHSGMFAAILTQTGERIWTTQLDDRVESTASVSKCGTYLVVGTYAGTLYALSPSTGRILGEFQLQGEIKSEIVISGSGAIWIGCHDGFVYTFEATKSDEDTVMFELIWKYDFGKPVYGRIELDEENQIAFIASTAGTVVAVDLSHSPFKIQWTYSCEKPVFSSPRLFSKEHLLVCTVGGKVATLSRLNGSMRWTKHIKDPIFSVPSTVCFHDCDDCLAVVGAHDKKLHLFDSTGHEVFSYSAESPIFSSPLVQKCKNHLRICFCCTLGTVYCIVLRIEGGGERSSRVKLVSEGKIQLGGEVFSSPVVVNDKIIIGCRDDYLYSLKIS